MRRITLAIGLLALALFLVGRGAPGRSSAVPAPAVPDGLGVNIHFTDPQPGELAQLAAGGFRWVRMDFDWNRIEVEKGRYDFTPYDRLMAALAPHRIRPVFILDYVHRLYDNARSPDTGTGRQAFARWAAASARHFRGRGILWEMYNEPNILPFWRPKPNVDDYIRLARATGQAIRAAAPGETFIGPAVSGMDFRFLEACFRAGVLEYWSAVSVHPYRQSDPETAAPEFRRLRQLIARYAPRGKRVPILSGEWGYSDGWSGMSAERQGKLLARQWLSNLANDVALSIWYDWHDDGPDPKEPEHHFGTVYFPYHAGREPVYDPKPSYRAARTLTSILNGYHFNKRLAAGSPDDYLLLFSRGDEVRLAAWSAARAPHPVRVPASPGRFRVTTHTRETGAPLTADARGLACTVTDAPQYLVPEKPNDLLRVAAAWERAPLEIVTPARKAARVSLTLRNPLSRPILVQTPRQRFRLPPGPSRPLTTLVDVPRTADPIPLRLEADLALLPSPLRGGAGGEVPLGHLAQTTEILAANPLRITFLPWAGNVLTVRVENPSGDPFHGIARLTGVEGLLCREPVRGLRFRAGEKETAVRFPCRPATAGRLPDYRVGLRVTGGPREPDLGISAARFRVVDDFARYPTRARPAGYTLVPDGDASVASEQSVTVDLPPEGPPAAGAGALKIDYRFSPGWKFVRLPPQGKLLRKIEGRPKALGLWVHGDGQGNIPRLRFTDSTGQTFQPDGEPITWRGWRYVLFPLDGSRAGHWGGAADGIIHSPIHWESLFLLDSADRQETHGAIYISQPTLLG